MNTTAAARRLTTVPWAVRPTTMPMVDAATGSVPVSGSTISGIACYAFQVDISIEGDDSGD